MTNGLQHLLVVADAGEEILTAVTAGGFSQLRRLLKLKDVAQLKVERKSVLGGLAEIAALLCSSR